MPSKGKGFFQQISWYYHPVSREFFQPPHQDTHVASVRIALGNLPGPPHLNVSRDVAGGYGRLHSRSTRSDYGHDRGVYMNPPLMEAYAAALAENSGADVDIVDGQVENLGLGRFVERVALNNPDIVFVRISLPSYSWDRRIVSALKKEMPDATLVAWGTVCRSMPDKVLEDFAADAVSGTTIESIVMSILTHRTPGVLRQDGTLMFRGGVKGWRGRHPALRVDSLPMPAYHLLKMDQYSDEGERFFSVFASRGCSFACEYCPYPVGFGWPWRGRDPRRVAAEIFELHDNYGVERIGFRDQTWNMDIRRSLKLCRLLESLGDGVEWNVAIRPDRLSLDLAQAMQRSGCFRVEMGVETGDPDVFRAVGKKASTLRLVERGFKNARRAGLTTAAHLMVGLPGETLESVCRTTAFLDRIAPDIVHVSIATPYPGTRFYDRAVENGWLVDRCLDHLDARTPVLDYPDFSTSEIVRAREALRGWHEADRILRDFRELVKKGEHIRASRKAGRFGMGLRRFMPRLVDMLSRGEGEKPGPSIHAPG